MTSCLLNEFGDGTKMNCLIKKDTSNTGEKLHSFALMFLMNYKKQNKKTLQQLKLRVELSRVLSLVFNAGTNKVVCNCASV